MILLIIFGFNFGIRNWFLYYVNFTNSVTLLWLLMLIYFIISIWYIVNMTGLKILILKVMSCEIKFWLTSSNLIVTGIREIYMLYSHLYLTIPFTNLISSRHQPCATLSSSSSTFSITSMRLIALIYCCCLSMPGWLLLRRLLPPQSSPRLNYG